MNTETIITLFGIFLGSNALWQFFLELYKSQSKKKTPSEIVLKALCRNHLLTRANYYQEVGYIPADEYDDIKEEFEAYEKLGGNGRVAREYGEGGSLKNLPVR